MTVRAHFCETAGCCLGRSSEGAARGAGVQSLARFLLSGAYAGVIQRERVVAPDVGRAHFVVRP